jgi:GNAT superfamily N-acetyltransferase
MDQTSTQANTICVLIRPATAQDAAAVAGILREVGWFDDVRAEPPAQTEDRARHYLAECSTHAEAAVFVAEGHDGEVLGFATVHWRPTLSYGYEGYLAQLYVRKDARGHGVGQRLVHQVKCEAAERNCQRLVTYISRTRPAYQRGFYAKSGWREREDAALFVLDLTR